MMTLEEKIRGLAAKGELTHISIAAKDGMFYANYAPASASGYAQGVDADPVTALEAALATSPVKPKRMRKPAESEPEPAAADAASVTVAVTLTDGEHELRVDPGGMVETGFPTDWTAP